MKGHPANPRLIKIDMNDRFMDFFNHELKVQVDRDKRDRWPWMEKMRRFHGRRYALDRRKPTFPFPGSSDVWPPLTDMIIEQMKTMYLSPLLISNPPVNVVGLGQVEELRAQDVESWFDYEINFDSPNFLREQNYYIDDVCSCGFGWLKTYYAYSTRTAPDTIGMDQMPTALQERIIHTVGDQQIQQLYLTPKIFDDLAHKPQNFGGQIFPSTQTLLEHYYDLDWDDPTDKVAIQQILEWMKDGARRPLTFKKRDTVVDAPATVSVMGENLIVPVAATDVEDCFHLSHEMWSNGFQIRANGRDGVWDPESVAQIFDNGRGREDPRFVRTGIQALEAQRQGMMYSGGDKYYIIESCTWFDYDKDGVDEKVIILWSPSAEKPLLAYAYDRPSGKWPYHYTSFEANKRGIFSPRGIPERLQDIEREMVVQKRAELNRLMISSALSLMVRSTSPLANQAIRWIPGEKLIVNDVDRDAKPLMFPDISVTFQQQERIWKTWGESYTGTPNYAITDPLAQTSEPRTKFEVQAIQGQGRQIGNTRTALHRDAMSKVFHEMFDLYQMLGPKQKWIASTDSEPLQLNKEDLQGAYAFILGPMVGLDNPELEAGKALARVQMLLQVAASGQMPPDMMIDLGEAVNLWLRKDDPRAAKRILRKRTPQEMQQQQQQQQQADMLRGTMLGIQHGQGVKDNGSAVAK